MTKQEDEAAWRARRYTRASPGKFRSSSKTISYWQVRTEQFTAQFKDVFASTIKKITPRIFYKERQKTQSAVTTHKARITRARKKELKEYVNKFAYSPAEENRALTADARLIEKFKKGGFKSLTEEEKKKFNHLFVAYPKDEVRGWLGSSMDNRRRRMMIEAA